MNTTVIVVLVLAGLAAVAIVYALSASRAQPRNGIADIIDSVNPYLTHYLTGDN